MKVQLKNQDGQLFIIDEDDRKYRVMYQTVTATHVDGMNDNWETVFIQRKIGAVVALQDVEDDGVLFSISQVSDKATVRHELKPVRVVNGEQLYAVREVVEYDEFDKDLAIKIAAGKALTNYDGPFIKPPFEDHFQDHNMEACMPEFQDALVRLYQRVQKIWLAPSRYRRDKNGVEVLRKGEGVVSCQTL